MPEATPVAVADAPPPERSRVTVAISPRSMWIALAIGAGVFLAVLLAFKALPALLLLFIAILLAEGMRPLVDRLTTWRIPRPLAVLLIYLVVLALLVGFGFLLAVPLVTQSVEFSAQLPAYGERLQDLLNSYQDLLSKNPDLANIINQLEGQAASELGSLAGTALSIPLGVVSVIFDLLVVLTMAFLWLTTMDRLKPFILSLLPEGNRAAGDETLTEMGRNMGGYVRGVLVNMLIIGTLTAIGLSILGVPYSLLLGVLAGLFEAIPFLGPWISGAVAVVVALVSSGSWISGVEVYVLFQVIQVLEGNTIVPLVMSRTARLNPLVVVLAVLIGGSLLGVIGSVLAVPAAAVIQVFVVRVLAPLARTAAQRVDAARGVSA